MVYSNLGRAVLAIVIVLSVLFLRSPWKSFFVYPFSHPRGKLFFSHTLIWVITVVLVVLWSFNIQRIDGSALVRTPRSGVVFLLDGSLSMSATDAQPNRFAHATSLISQLLGKLSATQSSLVVFSGLPVIRVPWTSDISGFVDVLSHMSLGQFPPTENFLGTALGDALLLSLQQFDAQPQLDSRAVVIISDGDSNKGYDPYKIIPLLQQRHIPVYFIGVGEEGYDVGVDRTGLPVITSFDADLMQQFTDKTAGKIYLNPTAADIDDISNRLSPPAEGSNVMYIPYTRFLNDIIEPWMLLFFCVLLVFSSRQLRIRKK